MGSRGQSSGSSGGGSVFKGQIDIGTDNIEFDGDLVYTKDDKGLTKVQRASMLNWENKRVKNKIEYATAIDANGNMMGEARGGKGSVSTPRFWKMAVENIFSHVHPREKGILGGTFSTMDLDNWVRFPARTYRATAKEGTYSITKNASFDGSGFRDYYHNAERARDNTYSAISRQLRTDYVNNKIDYDTYVKQANKAFNTLLVGLHNDLLAGQKTYGYNYHLEKR